MQQMLLSNLSKAMDTLKNAGTHPKTMNSLEDQLQALLLIP